MLTVQGSLGLGGSAPVGMEFLDSGLYSNVYTVPHRPDMVVKKARRCDGALAWLMFAQCNQGRTGVPVIESLALTESGYICTMRKYESMKVGTHLHIDMCQTYNPATGMYDYPVVPGHEYLKELEQEFFLATSYRFNDFHSGNRMWCNETNSVIVLDPNCDDMDDDDIETVRASLTSHYSKPFALEG